MFNNPFSRILLRIATANVRGTINGRNVEKSTIYYALSMLAGEYVNYPITARSAAFLVDSDEAKKSLQIISTAPQYGKVSIQMSGGEVAPTHFYVGNDPVVKPITEFIGGCGAGRIYSAIRPNGDVTPCVFMSITVGNIREKRCGTYG